MALETRSVVQLIIALWFLFVFTCVSCKSQPQSIIANNGIARIYEFINRGVARSVYSNLFAHRSNLSQFSADCSNSLTLLLNAFADDEQWSYFFIDASSSKPIGFTGMTMGVLGDYDECLDTRSYVEPPAKEFFGKHCSVEVVYKQ